MVRKKTLSPSGGQDEETGEYRNATVNINEDELKFADVEIGDEVYVRVVDGRIIIEPLDWQDDD